MRKLSKQAQEAGLSVSKRITGYAYARNGNTHNPTPRVRWELRNKEGQLLDTASTLSDLLSTAEEFVGQPPSSE